MARPISASPPPPGRRRGRAHGHAREWAGQTAPPWPHKRRSLDPCSKDSTAEHQPENSDDNDEQVEVPPALPWLIAPMPAPMTASGKISQFAQPSKGRKATAVQAKATTPMIRETRL